MVLIGVSVEVRVVVKFKIGNGGPRVKGLGLGMLACLRRSRGGKLLARS